MEGQAKVLNRRERGGVHGGRRENTVNMGNPEERRELCREKLSACLFWSFSANSADFLCDLCGLRFFSSSALRAFQDRTLESPLLGGGRELAHGRDEGAGRAGQGAVAAVGDGKFAPEFFFLGGN